MQSLDAYRRRRLNQRAFRQLYERECHICRHTVGIFKQMLSRGESPEKLAAATETGLADVIALMEAEHCDPDLAVRLCRHLGIEVPPACPRRSSPQ